MTVPEPSPLALRSARAILGVTAESDQAAVARAYRRRARRLHPDVSPEPDASEQFSKLHAAYRLAAAAIPTTPPPNLARRGARPEGTVRRDATPTTRVPEGPGPGPANDVWMTAGPVRVSPHRAPSDTMFSRP
jgi:hypothetical protein